MIRKLTAMMLMAGALICMAGGSAAEEAAEEETQIVDEAEQGQDTESETVDEYGYRVWQGYDEGDSFTLLLNTESGTASLAKTQSDGSTCTICGDAVIDDAGTLTISSADGTSAEMTAEPVSSCRTDVVYEDRNLTFVQAAPIIADRMDAYVWYAGLSEEGDAYTFGLSEDCSSLVFAFFMAGDETLYQMEFSLEVTASGNGAVSAVAADADGNSCDFSLELIGGDPLHAVIGLNGEYCEAYAIESRLFAA